jgi:rubrerythrin
MPDTKVETKNRLLFLAEQIEEGFGFCAQCGVTAMDEDGTCPTCGATAEGQALRSLAQDLKIALR